MLKNLPIFIKNLFNLNKNLTKYIISLVIVLIGVQVFLFNIFLDAQNNNSQFTNKITSQNTSQTEHIKDNEPNPSNLIHPTTKTYEAKVGKNGSLSAIFAKFNLSQAVLHKAINSNKTAKKLFTNLKPEQKITIDTDLDNNVIRIFSEISILENIELLKNEQDFVFNHNIATPYIEEEYAHGVIKSSLFSDARSIGLTDNLTIKLANIFAYDIDFTQDIREGDEFEVIYETKHHQNKNIGIGNILAARFTVKGATYTAILDKNNNGEAQYFNHEGKGMRKQFLRTPIEYARISSRFSPARKHPILNTIRAHRGVDYAAKEGTPIKVTADGKIIFRGWRGGYGNAVIVQHGNKYSTLYGHLSRFDTNAKNGNRVKQGQIIGYVGQTGLARGPHVHYEFRINGVHVDPLSRKLPTIDPAPVADKQKFLKLSVSLLARMDAEKNRTLAALKKNASNIN